MAETIIRISGLSKNFGGRPILRSVGLEVGRGETVVIMGGSGCGKSTFLWLLLGLYTPDEGRVEVLGTDVVNADREEIAALRKRVGVLFQSGALYNSMTVAENVALPLREHTDLDDQLVRMVVKMKLELVGLRDFEHHMPAQLSGGMKKRVGLARALAMDPEILFYDEPTTGLDPVMSGVINQLIRDLSRQLGVTSLVVTHDMGSAFFVADRLAMLYEGRFLTVGTPEEIRGSGDPLVRQFITGATAGPIPLRFSRTSLLADFAALAAGEEEGSEDEEEA